MATAGRILIMPKGAYSAGTTYEMLDLVCHNGKAWVAKKVSVGIEPSDAASEYWHDLLGNAGGLAFITDIDELKAEQKAIAIPTVSLSTTEVANEFFDNYSANFGDGTQYRTRISFAVMHPILGGSAADFIGAKTNSNYEWQMLISYNSAAPKIFMRSKYAGTWTEWSTKFLPLEGGTLSGPELWLYGGYGRVVVNQNSIQFDACKSPKDLNNRSSIVVSNNTDLENMVKCFTMIDGVQKVYNIHGAHNKPSGTYTGDGDATSKVIDTGAIGDMCVIVGGSCGVIAMPTGAFILSTSDTEPKALPYNQCHYAAGKLTIASSNNYINQSGMVYRYTAL